MQVRIPGKKASETLSIVERAAADLGIRINESRISGTRVTFTLRPLSGQPNPYQRISASGQATRYGEPRKVSAVCWHGHRDFFRRVYRDAVFAVFRTHPMPPRFDAYYRDMADFESKYRETAHRNLGSMWHPMAACEACTCPDSGNPY